MSGNLSDFTRTIRSTKINENNICNFISICEMNEQNQLTKKKLDVNHKVLCYL